MEARSRDAGLILKYYIFVKKSPNSSPDITQLPTSNKVLLSPSETMTGAQCSVPQLCIIGRGLPVVYLVEVIREYVVFASLGYLSAIPTINDKLSLNLWFTSNVSFIIICTQKIFGSYILEQDQPCISL